MGFGGSAWSRAKEMACTLRTSLEYYTGSRRRDMASVASRANDDQAFMVEGVTLALTWKSSCRLQSVARATFRYDIGI